MKWTFAEWKKFRKPLTVSTDIHYEMDMTLFPGLDDLSISSEPSLMIHLPEVLCHCPVAVANSSQSERCATPDVDLLCREDDKFLAYIDDDDDDGRSTPTDFLELIDDMVLTVKCKQLSPVSAASTPTLPPVKMPDNTSKTSDVKSDPFISKSNVLQQPFLHEQSLDPFVGGYNWPNTVPLPIMQHPQQKHSQFFSYMDMLNRYEPPVSINTPVQQPYCNRTVYHEPAIMPVYSEQNQGTTVFRPFPIRPFEISSGAATPWTTNLQYTIPTGEQKAPTASVNFISKPSELKTTLLNHQPRSCYLTSKTRTVSNQTDGSAFVKIDKPLSSQTDGIVSVKIDKPLSSQTDGIVSVKIDKPLSSQTDGSVSVKNNRPLSNQTNSSVSVKDNIKQHPTASTSTRTIVKTTSTTSVSGWDVNTLKSSSPVNIDKSRAEKSSVSITTSNITPPAKQTSIKTTTSDITPAGKWTSVKSTTSNITPPAKRTSIKTATPNITPPAKQTFIKTATSNITPPAKQTSLKTAASNIAPPAKWTSIKTATPNITPPAKRTSIKIAISNIAPPAKQTSLKTAASNIAPPAKWTSIKTAAPNITPTAKQTSLKTATSNIAPLAKRTSIKTATSNITPAAKRTSVKNATSNITPLAKRTSIKTATSNITPPAKQASMNTATSDITPPAKQTCIKTTTPNITPPAKRTSIKTATSNTTLPAKQISIKAATSNITPLAKQTSVKTATSNTAPPAKQTSIKAATSNITPLAKQTSVKAATSNITPPAKQASIKTATPTITPSEKQTPIKTTTPNTTPPEGQTFIKTTPSILPMAKQTTTKTTNITPLVKQTSANITTTAKRFLVIRSTVKNKSALCSNVDVNKPSTSDDTNPDVHVSTKKRTVEEGPIIEDLTPPKKASPQKRTKSSLRKLVVAMKFVTPKIKNPRKHVMPNTHMPALPVKDLVQSNGSSASTTTDSADTKATENSAKPLTKSPRTAVRQKFKPPCFCEVQTLKPRRKSSHLEKVCSQKTETRSCAKPESTLIQRSLETKELASVKPSSSPRSPRASRKRKSTCDSDKSPSKMTLRSWKYQESSSCELDSESCARPKSDTKELTSFIPCSPKVFRKRTSACDSNTSPSKMTLRSLKYQENGYCEIDLSLLKKKYTDGEQDDVILMF